MNAIEIARRLAELGQGESAGNAYALAIQVGGLSPEDELEAALYILQSGADYKIAYTSFRNLYDRGCFRQECLGMMTEAFYKPNEEELRDRYQKNCRLLSDYPYFFRHDFPPFEALPIRFYPFDDAGYLPFHADEARFEEYVNFSHPVVSRNFFRDMEKPILARDVYSQYELEYLRDNVRRSEYVARENHIYLHYTDWGTFCAHLQCLELAPVLKEEKVVFLMEDQEAWYPIDFKERFGVDYSQYRVRPIGVREVQRLIWHAQFSSHNGVDFFNEIFDSHPNLIFTNAQMFDNIEEVVGKVRASLDNTASLKQIQQAKASVANEVLQELYLLKDRTDKDILVGLFLGTKEYAAALDPNARIAPALFFQPHFGNVLYSLLLDEKKRAVLFSRQYEQIRNTPLTQNFKYIKTFTPMRRPTTSYGACIRFTYNTTEENWKKGKKTVIGDRLADWVLNRSYMVDRQDQLYTDSVLVRFEDGKLNPKATFTALAAFLDLPYTESMTYCSQFGERDPETLKGHMRGFDPTAIYRTYDDYTNDAERTFIEYFMRDAYEYYGYDFHYYDGQPMDEARLEALLRDFTMIDHFIRFTWKKSCYDGAEVLLEGEPVSGEVADLARKKAFETTMKEIKENRAHVAATLLQGLNFVGKNGQPLRMMPLLQLDPALLEQPLYR